MALGTPNTIMLKGDIGMREEAFAASGFKPGNFLVKDVNGKIAKNTLATGGDTPLMVAVEDSYQGKTITDAYVANEIAFYYEPMVGDLIYARVPAAAPAIVIGDRLQLDNTGCIVKFIAGKVVAVAEETLDNSAGGAEVFLRIRIGN